MSPTWGNKDLPMFTRLDNRSVDAFGHTRVATPVTLFDSTLTKSKSSLNWHTQTAGSGAATYLPNESLVRMRCGTASGDKVIRQSREYIHNQPGLSMKVQVSAVMGAAKANVRKRVGYFDTDNGLFFEQDSAGLYVVVRTYTSGAAVDTRVASTAWNLDRLDGSMGKNNVSRKTLDITKIQLFLIDFQCIEGRVRFGFNIDGEIYYCHEVLNTNSLTTVFMSTTDLPVRFEIENTGTAGSATDLLQVCATVFSEGGAEEDPGWEFTVNTGAGGPTASAFRGIIAIRPRLTYQNKRNTTQVHPLAIDMLATSKDVLYEGVIIRPGNGTYTRAAGLTWRSHNSCFSVVDVCTAACTCIGGHRVISGFLVAGGSGLGGRDAASKGIVSKGTLCLNYSGTTGDIFAVRAQGFGGVATLRGAIYWRENR